MTLAFWVAIHELSLKMARGIFRINIRYPLQNERKLTGEPIVGLFVAFKLNNPQIFIFVGYLPINIFNLLQTRT